MAGFIQLLRAEPAEALLRYPNAFALLTLIALRARREVPQINPHGLQIGEAMVGDFAAVGLTRQEFRSAISNLQKWSLITIRATNKGTIAKLSDSSVYDINSGATNQQPNQPTTNQQPASNQQATTNNNVIKKEGNKTPMSDSATPSPDGAGFEVFWQEYGRKEGSKGKMNKQWDALKFATRQTILNGLSTYRQAKMINGPQFMPMPQTFLNGRLWEAETYGQAPPLSAATRPPVVIPDDPCSLWGAPNPDYDHRTFNQPAGQYAGTVQ